MIYFIIIYFYSIWITINCDDWSSKLFKIYDLKYKEKEDDDDYIDEEEENEIQDERNLNEEEEDNDENDDYDLIPGGDKMKYYILLIAGINMIINIFIEWFVMKLVNNCYENKLIKVYKREVEEEKVTEARNKYEVKDNKGNLKEVKIFKYQRIYYYDRRMNSIKQKTEEKSIDVKTYSESEKKI